MNPTLAERQALYAHKVAESTAIITEMDALGLTQPEAISAQGCSRKVHELLLEIQLMQLESHLSGTMKMAYEDPLYVASQSGQPLGAQPSAISDRASNSL